MKCFSRCKLVSHLFGLMYCAQVFFSHTGLVVSNYRLAGKHEGGPTGLHAVPPISPPNSVTVCIYSLPPSLALSLFSPLSSSIYVGRHSID